MNHYRLRFDTKEQAQQLVESLGIEWAEPHMTHMEGGRIDVTVLGDLPKQNADGSITMTGEGEEAVPVMTGKYHIDILSEVELEVEGITPTHPLHKFAGE
jgi:hypothetical protein